VKTGVKKEEVTDMPEVTGVLLLILATGGMQDIGIITVSMVTDGFVAAGEDKFNEG
jgi:hypothetical protein